MGKKSLLLAVVHKAGCIIHFLGFWGYRKHRLASFFCFTVTGFGDLWLGIFWWLGKYYIFGLY